MSLGPRCSLQPLTPKPHQSHTKATPERLRRPGRWRVTLALSRESSPHDTAIQNLPENAGAAVTRYVLMDNDYIYPLKVGLNTVGRMRDNDVVVQDACVSRRHCAVVVHTGDRCELHDIASKNGTYLNGHKIAGPTRLHSGNQIRMCNRNLIFLRKTDLAEKTASVPPTHSVGPAPKGTC